MMLSEYSEAKKSSGTICQHINGQLTERASQMQSICNTKLYQDDISISQVINGQLSERASQMQSICNTKLDKDDISISQHINGRLSERAPIMQSMSYSEVNKNDVYLCAVCHEIFNDPYLAKCGHSFCFKCMTDSIKKLNCCPTCQKNLTLKDIVPNELFNQLVMKYKNCRKILINRFRKSEQDTDFSDINALQTILKRSKELIESGSSTSESILFYYVSYKLRKLDMEKNTPNLKLDLQAIEDILNDLRKNPPKVEDVQMHLDQDTPQMRDLRAEFIDIINYMEYIESRS